MDDWQKLALAFAIVGMLVAAVRYVHYRQDKAHKQGTWEGEVNSDRAEFKTFMDEIRAKIDRIFERLPPSPVASGSPLKLTELGERISHVLNGKDWARDHAREFSGKLAGKTNYEIQEMCKNYTRDDYDPADDTMDERIDDCAFEFGISRQSVLDVLAVELRDVLILQRNPLQ